MTLKALIECDGDSCDSSHIFEHDEFEYGDLPTVHWHFDQDTGYYYCSSCTQKMIANGEIEE